MYLRNKFVSRSFISTKEHRYLYNRSHFPSRWYSSKSQYNDITKKLIQDNPVMVFSKSWCPFCREAKGVLRDLHVKYEAIELDQRNDGDAIQESLLDVTGQRTVPNIFVGGKHVGGCSDLKTKKDNNELYTLFEESGISYSK